MFQNGDIFYEKNYKKNKIEIVMIDRVQNENEKINIYISQDILIQKH